MTIRQAKSLQQILSNKKSPLFALVVQIKQLRLLNHIFHKIITNELSLHCNIAKLENDVLHLVVDSSAWATNLRFSIPDITKLLQTQPEFKQLKKIRYKIDNHIQMKACPKTKTKNPIGIHNAEQLKNLAKQLADNKS